MQSFFLLKPVKYFFSVDRPPQRKLTQNDANVPFDTTGDTVQGVPILHGCTVYSVYIWCTS